MSTRSDGWAGRPARGWVDIEASGPESASNLPRGSTRLGRGAGYSSARMGPEIVPLDNPVQNYAWGSRTAIADLLGRPSPEGRPEAELWIGAHPQAPSRAANVPGGPRARDALKRLFAWLWSRPTAERVPLVDRAVAAAARRRGDDAAFSWMERLHAKY